MDEKILIPTMAIACVVMVLFIGTPQETSVSYLYENVTEEVPVYNEEIIEVKPSFNVNGTFTEAYNYTNRTISSYKQISKPGKKIGIVVDGKQYLDTEDIYVYNDKNVVIFKQKSKWGDRNFEEYPTCRHEKEVRAGCQEIEIEKFIKENDK